MVRYGEAIGLGDLRSLNALASDGLVPANPDAPLPGGTIPLDLAVHYRRAAAVDWLEARDAVVTATHAWALGGPARTADLLRRYPDRRERREGPFGATPLHRAVEDDDLPRVRFLLDQGADTGCRDARFGSTPLGWAKHLGREAIAACLVAAGAPP
jgi:hypothetical protein